MTDSRWDTLNPKKLSEREQDRVLERLREEGLIEMDYMDDLENNSGKQ